MRGVRCRHEPVHRLRQSPYRRHQQHGSVDRHGGGSRHRRGGAADRGRQKEEKVNRYDKSPVPHGGTGLCLFRGRRSCAARADRVVRPCAPCHCEARSDAAIRSQRGSAALTGRRGRRPLHLLYGHPPVIPSQCAPRSKCPWGKHWRGNPLSHAPCGVSFFPGIRRFFVGTPQQVVHAHLIQVSQAAQHIYGIVQHAYLVLRVCVLLHIQIFRQLLLGHAGIHTQAADIFIR